MKKIIFTDKAPQPIGPYNQAILSHNTLYISGQIPTNPLTGETITESIELETKQVLENLRAILEAAEMTFENVVKTTIFLTDMTHFGKINDIYAHYINQKTAPARETVQVTRLPKNVNIEISMIAVK